MPGQQIEANKHKSPLLSLKVILMIEGNNDFGKFCKRAIQADTPYHVMLTGSGDGAWRTLQHIQADMLLLTHRPPHSDGLKIYDRLQTLPGITKIPAILIEGSDPIPFRETTRRHLTLIKQPLVLPGLIATIEKLFAETEEPRFSPELLSNNLYLDSNELLY